MGTIKLDIVIPSFNLNENLMLKIFNLKHSKNLSVKFILVIDNPDIIISKEFNLSIKNKNILLYRNQENIGASLSRNKGIEASTGDWILFLDDDIEVTEEILEIYYKLLLQYPKATGFAGVTRFPDPVNSFTRGIKTSDILTFFDIAEHQTELIPWGVTANLLLNRKKLGDIRFSSRFPKSGGGEDIDLCLQVSKKTGQALIPAKDSIVYHPWWANGRRSYKRFARWAYGDAQLPKIFPEYKYRNFPNLIEMLFMSLLTLTCFLPFYNVPLLYPAIIFTLFFSEFSGEYVKCKTVKNKINPVISIESMLVRNSNDLGRFIGNLVRKNFTGITERFDYFCDGKHINFERKWALVKFSIAIFSSIVCIALFTVKIP